MKIILSLKSQKSSESAKFWRKNGVDLEGVYGVWETDMEYATAFPSVYDFGSVYDFRIPFNTEDFEFILLNDKNEPEICLTYEEAFDRFSIIKKESTT